MVKLNRNQITLPSADQVATADRKNYLNRPILSEWLYSYPSCAEWGTKSLGYWTSTSVSDGSGMAWRVYHNGTVGTNRVDNVYYNGVRPVITLSI